MPARVFLAVVRADEHAHRPAPDDVIPFVLRRDLPLFIALVVRPARDTAHSLAWSDWPVAVALMSSGWGALCESDHSTIRDPLLREYPIRWPAGGRTLLNGAA